MTPFLELSRVGKTYGGVVALRDLEFDIAPGEVHCLVGENGSGKSTLIKIICGVETPSPGARIVIDGAAHPHLTRAESSRLGIQVIYQDLSLFPNLSVAENIASALLFNGLRPVDRRAVRRTAEEAMQRIGVHLNPDALVQDLSIAQRQLVAICRAISAEARLVIMDEPTASLTRREVDALLALVRQLKQKGLSILFVSHRLDEVLSVAERVTVLRDGRKVGTFDAREMNDKKLSMLMTGKEFVYELKACDPEGKAPVLSVSGLSKQGQFQDISFDLRPGEVLGITGRLGAGRTELALALFGMNTPDAGEIRIDGKPVQFASNRDAAAQGIAYVPEDRLTQGLVLEQPIGANIVLSIMERLAGRFGLFRAGAKREAIGNWIRDLSIKAPDPDAPVRTLSGGNQQRVVLAKWMARQPRVLILDSPTVGVDVSAKDGIYEIVGRLAREGVAIIMISDEVPEVLYHCHRIMVMREGRIAAEYAPHETSEHALLAEVDA